MRINMHSFAHICIYYTYIKYIQAKNTRCDFMIGSSYLVRSDLTLQQRGCYFVVFVTDDHGKSCHMSNKKKTWSFSLYRVIVPSYIRGLSSKT